MKAPFQDGSAFAPSPRYDLLPFRFGPLDAANYVVTNDVGEYVVLSRSRLVDFVERKLDWQSETYKELKSRHFLYDDASRSAVPLLALKYRSRVETMRWFTGLHIFVVTLRCDHSCRYCQVSRQTEDRTQFDMTLEQAEKALALTFKSPSPTLKIEFQGGEPLLNFPLIRYVVERAIELNRQHKRDVQFVIASNLSRLTDEMLDFCREHQIYLSTSIDGPEDIHDKQRPVSGGHSYRATVGAIERARAALGAGFVSALMTTTEASLSRVEEIVDEYARLGFHSVFLRSMSPYGFAVRKSLMLRYGVADWIEFYIRGLRRVIDLNQRGYRMREDYSAILLQKMFAPLGSHYVDLQSPSGIGIGALVYNYDGAVFASDEGRMLAEMGDQSFRLGHVDTDSYESMMTSEMLLGPLADSMTEGAPMCTDCPFLPYCGADPVFHRATQGDTVGHKAFSAFCTKQMGVLRHLIGLLESDPAAREVLTGWV